MGSPQSVSPVCTALLYSVVLVSAASTGQNHSCPEYHYWDHGTELCENCRDICDREKSKHMGTLDQCWELCKPFALSLWPPKPAGVPAAAQPSSQDEKATNDLPHGAAIAITVVSLTAMGLLCTLILVKRRAIVNVFRRNPDLDPVRQTASVALLDPRAEQGRQDGGSDGGRVSVLAAAGSSPCHTLTMDSQFAPQFEPRFPVQVSPEGDVGVSGMALPKIRPSQNPCITVIGNAGASSCSPNEDEYHSTELKTLQPSAEGAVGGVPATRVSPSVSGARF